MNMPYCPYERRRELSDLWEADQAEFRRMVDIILDGPTSSSDTSNFGERWP